MLPRYKSTVGSGYRLGSRARLVRRALGFCRGVSAVVNNRVSTKAAIDDKSTVVVSLTTHGRRVEKCYAAIESIAAGAARPNRLILWLNDASLIGEGMPPSLRRLVRRGLEVRLSENFGPHTKYYPYLLSEPTSHAPLVTADDDILYPKNWLQSLLQAASEEPTDIVCHRAKVMRMSGEVLQPYMTWPDCHNAHASTLHFATGVSGVLYPPEFLDKLRGEGDRFQEIAPKADDVWINSVAFRSGHAVRQVSANPALFPFVWGSQGQGLVHQNAFGGENDRQLGAAYTSADVRRLREDGDG
jgi:hypothetical protein